jgi:hypothetical protein
MKVQINKPIVKRQIRGVKFIRSDRGFSKSELKEAGIIDISMAMNKGIPIDILRKTTIAENRLQKVIKFEKSSRKKRLNTQKLGYYIVCCFRSNSCILAVKAITWSDSCAIAPSFILSRFLSD